MGGYAMSINDMIVSDYFDKGVDFSASDFTRPNYQLWVSRNYDKNKDEKQSLPAWVGQLVHKASYDFPEVNVIKEYSPVVDFGSFTIGGSVDRIVKVGCQWVVEDIKTQGMYPAKKAFKEPDEKWVKQLSIYNFLLQRHGFNMASHGVIHQYVMGYQKNKDGMNDYNKIEIPLMTLEETIEMIDNKVDIATADDEPIFKDCPEWMCESYCSYSQNCPHHNKEVK